jgi:hypothetical protein
MKVNLEVLLLACKEVILVIVWLTAIDQQTKAKT